MAVTVYSSRFAVGASECETWLTTLIMVNYHLLLRRHFLAIRRARRVVEWPAEGIATPVCRAWATERVSLSNSKECHQGAAPRQMTSIAPDVTYHDEG